VEVNKAEEDVFVEIGMLSRLFKELVSALELNHHVNLGLDRPGIQN